MGNPYPATFIDQNAEGRLVGEVDFTDPANRPGGSVTPPVTFTGTDPAEVVLTIEADTNQTANALEVYNKDGDLSLDVDRDGITDMKLMVVQDPPDTGTGNVSTVISPGAMILTPGVGQNPLQVQNTSFQALVFVRHDGFGSILEVSPRTDSDVAIQIIQSATPTVNQVELWDHGFNNVLFAVTKNGGVIFASADPHVVGAWWDNAGTLTRSSG